MSEWLETPEAERVSYEPARELRRVHMQGGFTGWQVWTTEADPQPVTQVYRELEALAGFISCCRGVGAPSVMGDWRPTYPMAMTWLLSQSGETK